MQWDTEKIFHSGDDFFQSLLQAIQNAEQTIDIEAYIFDQDTLGNRVLDTLRAAVRRGVTVRILFDGIGISNWYFNDLEKLRNDGISVNVYHPLPWQILRSIFAFLMRIREIWSRLWYLNKRNHRKICIIDGKKAFVGGMNISERHLQEFQGEQAWRDTSVLVEGVGIEYLSSAFDVVWRVASSKKLKRLRKNIYPARLYPLVRLNNTRKNRRLANHELIRHILKARHRIWITNAYIVPSRRLLKALRLAAHRGVDVRLLLPEKTVPRFMITAAHAFYPFLQKVGVKIYEYSASILHAKILLIDDWATVGSSNLNHRSIIHDLEVDIVLTHPQSIENLEQQFLQDLRKSHRILPTTQRRQLFFQRITQWIVLQFRYWI